ncbi:MAG: flagellar motor switch protein FliG [Myxococcota bacterium]|nr:flagellar motor switch protein FliG [Myxococcota bacterium]
MMADAEKKEETKAKKKGKPKERATSLAKSDDVSNVSGTMKAALWMLSVEEELAVEIMSHLSQPEISAISAAVQNLAKTNPAQLAAIHNEFNQLYALEPLHLKGSMDYLGTLATRAFGEDKGMAMLGLQEDIFDDEADGLNEADVDVLSSILKMEHPQIIAAVLANLEPLRSAEILKRVPENVRRDVVGRIAGLSRVPRQVLEAAERVLSAGLPSSRDADREIDGIRTAAQLLNHLESEVADEILDGLESETDTVATDIRQAMFTFEDLSALDRRGFATLLKEVQSDQLLVALKTASDDLKEKVFSSLSKRAAEMLRDDLEVMRPVRLAEVQEAQQAVVSVALQLKNEGKLVIAGAGGDEFV